MTNFKIKDICNINTNQENNTFVGIKCIDGEVSINFPLGFNLSNNEVELRRDILLLLNTIAHITNKKDSTIMQVTHKLYNIGFPLQSYLYIISDYFSNGYYKEREFQYKISDRGKINWNKTIKTLKPFIQDSDVYYTKFITKKNYLKDDELITLIHEYCVYESFCKIGWLYTPTLPLTPRIKFNKELFKTIITNKYLNTFNDRKKELFSNMLAIIDNIQDANSPLNYQYGIDPFDYIWEKMIDIIFGIKDKKIYFPTTKWFIDGTYKENSKLQPDTIMLWNSNVYILDAKNYKYGKTRNNQDLPGSTDINKQITYGEYIYENNKFKEIHGEDFKIFNAFIMPYNSSEWKSNKRFLRIGEATANWKNGNKEYEFVQGILVDVKSIMNLITNPDKLVIEELSKCIENYTN